MNKKSVITVFIFLMLIIIPSICYAQNTWYYDSEELTTNVKIKSSFEIIPKSSTYLIEQITANITFYPKDLDNQDIISIDINPKPISNINQIIFEWDNPKEKILEYSIDSKIRTKNRIPKIQEKVSFPLYNIKPEEERYLDESTHIDITQDISTLATKLAEGEDDLFEVELKFSNWISENVKYDLSTLTADVSQKSSWVLKNKQGVCDEITNLFIALNRAAGVPARFVSGIAYTEAPEFPENWGGHGWAEVYFPNYGWVPFDITYKEYGYVDPTHIIFDQAIDSEDSATKYEWRGKNVEIKTSKLDIKTDVISTSGEVSENIGIKVKALYDEIGFGSYNMIEADITNNNDYYYAIEVSISKPGELELSGKKSKSLVLRPKETRTIYWTVKLNNNLDENYIYSFPISVYSLRNTSAQTKFTSTVKSEKYGYDDLKLIEDAKNEEREKEYSSSIEFNCNFEKEEYKQFDEGIVICSIKNTGSINLNSINACIETECEYLDIKINNEQEIRATKKLNAAGKQRFKATLSSNEISKIAFFETKVIDKPKIIIGEINNPSSIGYDQDYIVNFKIIQGSISEVKNVKVTLKSDGFEKSWNIEDFEKEKSIDIQLNSINLKKGQNKVEVILDYYDINDSKFQENKSFDINLENLTWTDNIKYFFMRIALLFR